MDAEIIERVAQALFAKLIESRDEHLSVRGDDPGLVTINGDVYLRILARVAVDAVRTDPLAAAGRAVINAADEWYRDGRRYTGYLRKATQVLHRLRAERPERDSPG